MRTFDFVCDARISATIDAKDEKAAREKWDEFCRSLDDDDYLASGGQGFYVHLADEEPEIEEYVDTDDERAADLAEQLAIASMEEPNT
jgi:hypothetical protein